MIFYVFLQAIKAQVQNIDAEITDSIDIFAIHA
jgi:hypothetical protein